MKKESDARENSGLRTRLSSFLNSTGDLNKNVHPVVGVSGGLDSVVLLHLLSELGYSGTVAHVHYGLRGKASHTDWVFVRDLAAEYKWQFRELDVSGKQPSSGSMQAWGRRIRYDWFARLADVPESGLVAVAHHADDQLESMLLNLNRGTGFAGLAGMSISRSLSKEVNLFRPLLTFTRSELEAYAEQEGLKWREDVSNQDSRYTRNALRLELDDMDPVAYEAFREAALRVQRGMRKAKSLLLRSIEGGTFLSDDELSTVPASLRGWIILEMIARLDVRAPRRHSVVLAIEELTTRQVGKRIQVGQIVVVRERGGLAFAPASSGTNFDRLVLDKTDALPAFWEVPGGRLHAEISFVPNDLRDLPASQAVLNVSLESEWTVRKWQDGDRFNPLGAPGSKKVKTFLTDRSVSALTKRDVQVLLVDGEIAWVIGHQIDDRFKVGPNMEHVLHFSWESA